MDASLDEIIAGRPRGGGRGGRGGRRPDRRPAPPRAPRSEDYPRDSVRKYREDDPVGIDLDWVHDKFEDERYGRGRLFAQSAAEEDGDTARRRPKPTGTRIRVDNLHYELTEDDLRELCERIGPVISVRLQYDRVDRSTGIAYVVYEEYNDARRAVAEYNGHNAYDQPIYLTLVSNDASPASGSLLDRTRPPVRSLFERIGPAPGKRGDGPDGARRRGRSASPRRSMLAPPDVDRYAPGGGSRSPIRRRGAPRGGRRPGAPRDVRDARDAGGRGGRRQRADNDGRQIIGGRPRKNLEELDAEMDDYWQKREDPDTGSKNTSGSNAANGAGRPAPGGDVDMDIID